jgi:branched-chain amino acid transport system permease protein
MNVLNPEFWIFVLVVAGIYAIFSLGLQLQFGYGGLLNFGQVGFALVATYTMGILVVRHGVDLWLASLVAVGLAMVAGVIAAAPTLRLKAFYLGIATIALSEIMRYLALNLQGFTGGPQGSPNLLGPGFAGTYTKQWFALLDSLKVPLEPIMGELATRDTAMLIIVWSVVAVVMVLLSVLVRSPWGRALRPSAKTRMRQPQWARTCSSCAFRRSSSVRPSVAWLASSSHCSLPPSSPTTSGPS